MTNDTFAGVSEHSSPNEPKLYADLSGSGYANGFGHVEIRSGGRPELLRLMVRPDGPTYYVQRNAVSWRPGPDPVEQYPEIATNRTEQRRTA